MPSDIPNLWSDSIKPGILSPLAILKSQAVALKEQTDGILVPVIDSEEHSTRIKHTLVIVVPALNGYRYSALEVAHHQDRPYPVLSLGPGLWNWQEAFNDYLQKNYLPSGTLRADNQDDFIQILSEMLQHPSLVGTLQGLIARVGDI